MFPKALIDMQIKAASLDVLRYLHTVHDSTWEPLFTALCEQEGLTTYEQKLLARRYILKATESLIYKGLIKYRVGKFSLTNKGRAYKLPRITLDEIIDRDGM